MACPICTRLLAEPETLGMAHMAAHDAMIGASAEPTADFLSLKAAANEAQIDAACARLELESHRTVLGSWSTC